MLSDSSDWVVPAPLAPVSKLDLSLLPEALVPPPAQAGTPVDGKRRLTTGEISLSQLLFKNSIDYSKVWVHREEFCRSVCSPTTAQ